jgi:hypothetical protein
MALPLELIDNVCFYLPAQDLLAVATANSLLCAVAQRLLFREVSVTTGKLPVALTLSNKPHLARHVRVFNVVVGPAANVLPAYYRALSTAISHMRELVSLSITVPAHHSSILPSDPRLSFPRLRVLQASFTLDPHVVRFLAKAPGLVALTLDHGPDPPYSEIPPTSIPRLASFSGSSQAAQLLVPGRPVSSIFLSSGDLTEDVVSALSMSSAAVSTLDATTTSLPLPILESLAVAMPQLEKIRLTTTYNLWDEFFNTVSTHLHSFTLHRSPSSNDSRSSKILKTL